MLLYTMGQCLSMRSVTEEHSRKNSSSMVKRIETFVMMGRSQGRKTADEARGFYSFRILGTFCQETQWHMKEIWVK